MIKVGLFNWPSENTTNLACTSAHKTIVPACGVLLLMIVIFTVVSVVTRRFTDKDKG